MNFMQHDSSSAAILNLSNPQLQVGQLMGAQGQIRQKATKQPRIETADDVLNRARLTAMKEMKQLQSLPRPPFYFTVDENYSIQDKL